MLCSAALSISHQRVEMDQAVVVELHIQDAMLAKHHLPSVGVSVTRPDPSPAGDLERLELQPSRGLASGESASGESDESHHVYKTVWEPRHTGRLELKVTEPALHDLNINLSIEVIHPDDELRHPMPDHDRLKALADLSGGQLVPPDRIQELVSLVPNRARRTPNDLRQPLWDAPITLLVVVVLLTVEWVGRKVIRLV